MANKKAPVIDRGSRFSLKFLDTTRPIETRHCIFVSSCAVSRLWLDQSPEFALALVAVLICVRTVCCSLRLLGRQYVPELLPYP